MNCNRTAFLLSSLPIHLSTYSCLKHYMLGYMSVNNTISSSTMDRYRSRFNRESGEAGAVPATVNADDRRKSHCGASRGKAGGRMMREPVDLPAVVKRHFLRGLRSGSERVPTHSFLLFFHLFQAPVYSNPSFHCSGRSPAEESFFSGASVLIALGKRLTRAGLRLTRK